MYLSMMPMGLEARVCGDALMLNETSTRIGWITKLEKYRHKGGDYGDTQ